jgi:hypothetical protein
MSYTPYAIPTYQGSAFHCPTCNVYSNQIWGKSYSNSKQGGGLKEVESYHFCYCVHCYQSSFWVEDQLVYPISSPAPKPNLDIPENVLSDYLEASSIVNLSPKGSAALLRLCIQKLCKHLGEPGNNINKDIASLVKKGLNPDIQKSLDVVRVIGNEAVHPGTIDLNEKRETALALFDLVNFIVDAMITQPKAIQSMYSKLPEVKRTQIEDRDK